ncbi:hypothetical protein Ahy_A01g001472 [Arachis hypogaea]|uniref:Zinc finger PMZ-type domain-containing protein n=1 Tax=Arachis hypogaea TaxID=3818 RepID=A0A445ENP9_ARAHY|nr:hypothetical protein Ahy_A01g001472 [Arachis hypogaea]
MTGIPCPHTCAAIKLLHGNIYTYVEECYLKSSQEKIYASSMIPIETHDMPDVNNLTLTDWENNIFLMPPTTTRPPGRPCKKRRESQFQDVRVYKCSRCDQSGHGGKSCILLAVLPEPVETKYKVKSRTLKRVALGSFRRGLLLRVTRGVKGAMADVGGMSFTTGGELQKTILSKDDDFASDNLAGWR